MNFGICWDEKNQALNLTEYCVRFIDHDHVKGKKLYFKFCSFKNAQYDEFFLHL